MNHPEIFIHQHAADALRALAKPEAILAFIKRLHSNPNLTGDHREADPRGRMIDVKVLGRHAVLYFNDPFAGLIRILDIRHTEASGR